MGRSYTLTWEARFKDKEKADTIRIIYGMSISEIIKHLIIQERGKVKDVTLTIWHQVSPMTHPVRKLQILRDFDYPDNIRFLHDIFKHMGLDYNKPIPRRLYKVETVA